MTEKVEHTPGLRRVVIAGGTGMLGAHLARYAQSQSFDVTVLTRGESVRRDNISYVHWDGRTLGDWVEQLDAAKYLVNLAGASINRRYSAAVKEDILNSRIDSVNVLSAAIDRVQNPPLAWVQASAGSIYGNKKELCDEHTPASNNFPYRAYQQWESALWHATTRCRKSILRVSYVLDQNGGYWPNVYRLASGAVKSLGNGRQQVSWIHIQDMSRLWLWAANNAPSDAIFNAATQDVVSNGEFMQRIRRRLGKTGGIALPSPIVRLGAMAQGNQANIVLNGRPLSCRRLTDAGFEFDFAKFDQILDDFMPT